MPLTHQVQQTISCVRLTITAATPVHSCLNAGNVLHLLMDFLGDANTAAALDVVFFVREVMETNSALRPTVLARLLDSFADIRSSRVCTCGLWIIGEYSVSQADIESALEVGRGSGTCCAGQRAVLHMRVSAVML